MDFDTGNGGFSGRGGEPRVGGGLFGGDTSSPGVGAEGSWWVRFFGGGTPDRARRMRDAEARANGAAFRIPGGARKDVLVSLAVAVWKAGHYDPKAALAEVRGHDIPHTAEGEAKLVRALSRTSMPVIEHVLGPRVCDKRVVVEGHLAGSARTALERLGAEVEELSVDDEKRYIDMTPLIFVVAAVAMGARYISLGLDNQQLYILAGLVFALMYGLRPFFFKMQRPQGS